MDYFWHWTRVTAVLMVCGLLVACQQEEAASEDQAINQVAKPDGKPESPPEPEVAISEEYKAEIAALKTNTDIERALALIEEGVPAARERLITLTEIPAPPFGEEARGRKIAEMMTEIGLTDVHIDEAGNVIARYAGRSGEKVVALAAHMDTVFPAGTDVTVKIEENKLVAPGIGDNTRGVISLLEIARAIVAAGIQTKAGLLFVANVGEEGLGDLRGVKHLFREGGPQIDAFIAIDGGENNRIVYGAVGSHRYRVTYKGPGGHSWGAFGLANPHHALGRAINQFMQDAPAVSWVGEKTSFNIGRIGGGTSVNSIPFESWMEVDMRSGNQEKIDAMDAVFQAAVQKGLAEENASRLHGPELTVEIEPVGKRPAGVGDPGSPLVQRILAVADSFGIEPELARSSTDANIPISLGIPAITISRGGQSGGAHSLQEYWTDTDSHIGPGMGLLVMLASAGVVQ